MLMSAKKIIYVLKTYIMMYIITKFHSGDSSFSQLKVKVWGRGQFCPSPQKMNIMFQKAQPE